jgi:hypothetical protein
MNMSKEIQLTRGKVAIVDDEDYEWLNQWKWHYTACASTESSHGYATRSITIAPNKQTQLYMHKLILGLPKGVYGDHIDGNTLNNTRANLRIATPQQNAFNRKHESNAPSRFKGVLWHKRDKRWMAYICKNRHIHHLGYFKTDTEAALAYNKAALIYHGEFAKLNQIEGELMC